jgi:hypothetical protein
MRTSDFGRHAEPDRSFCFPAGVVRKCGSGPAERPQRERWKIDLRNYALFRDPEL